MDHLRPGPDLLTSSGKSSLKKESAKSHLSAVSAGWLEWEGGLGRGLIVQENYIQIAKSGPKRGIYYACVKATLEKAPTLSLIIDPYHVFAAKLCIIC